ncbi:MAG TPA: tetratricopeptide repeat protein, partial [Aestuariivirga sp.]|nr:tetratricopeptide repeat protein [Aestuariivirga sp.]
MGKHIGSTIALILGILGFASGLTQLTDMIVGGPALILGALVYRSCKKRKLGEVDNTTLRLVLELTALASIVLLIGLQNDLRNRIIQEPVPNLIIPLCVILAYAIVVLRKFPIVETKAFEPKLIDHPVGPVMESSKENAAIWYIAARGSEAGPFPKLVVQKYLASGELSLDDGCWREGFTDWLPLGRTLEFATRSSPSPQSNQPAQDPFEREQREPPISPKHADPIFQKYKPDETIHSIKKRNYFARHWRGELSLAKSYWLNTYGLTLVIAILSVGLGSSDIVLYPKLISSLLISLWLFAAISQVWLTVGIYRSARVYSTTYPNKKGWGGAAILLTTLGLISSVVVFANQGIPQIRGYAEILSAASQVKNYSVKLLGDLTKIELRGNLDFGVSADVEAMLNDYPAVRVLYLNSIGGRLAEADKLKDLVLQHNLDTYVVSECHSACVTVFVAGRNRLISRTALIGLHEPYFPGLDIRELEAAKEGVKKFFYSRGIDGAVIEKGFAVNYESIWNPEHAVLFSSRIATGYASDEDVALGNASPAHNIADLGKALVVNPNDSVLYNNRGLAYSEQGEYDRAIADLNKALELNPKFEAAYYNRGLANYNKGSYERAIADFDMAIEINPANAVAYNNRGLVYNDMGDYDRAIVDLDKSIELDPNYATSRNNRGLAYANKGENDLAIADLDKAIELN